MNYLLKEIPFKKVLIKDISLGDKRISVTGYIKEIDGKSVIINDTTGEICGILPDDIEIRNKDKVINKIYRAMGTIKVYDDGTFDFFIKKLIPMEKLDMGLYIKIRELVNKINR